MGRECRGAAETAQTQPGVTIFLFREFAAAGYA
jgi:hypothetical protein